MYVIRSGTTWREGLECRVAEAPQPGDHDVLVRIRAAALNLRDLRPANSERDTVPLSDGAGEVVSLGKAVTRLKVGDRVAANFFPLWTEGRFRLEYHQCALGGTADGMLTEYKALPELSWVKIPAHLTYEQGATLPCSALTAWHALEEVNPVRTGETVLVIGTGGVALFALKFLRIIGARAIVVSSSEERRSKVRALGAEVIDSLARADWAQAVLELTNGEGADHVVELGGPGTLSRSLAATRAGGHVKMIGAIAGRGATIDPMPIIVRGVTVDGIFVGSSAMFERMSRAIAVNRLQPLIDRVFELDQIGEAYALQQSGRQFGKVVIRVAQFA